MNKDAAMKRARADYERQQRWIELGVRYRKFIESFLNNPRKFWILVILLIINFIFLIISLTGH